jgi:hypothetical protein
MKTGNWIALHKELRYFLPSGREYTILEAMFSYTLDIDNGKEGTISGYSKLWGWSRTRVRKFVEELKTVEGHLTNRQRTGKRHQILLKLNNLQNQKDTSKTGKKQLEDTQVDTTINPNPNPKPEPKKSNRGKKFIPPTIEEVTAYCLERKNGVNPKKWWNHYKAKGWMIGKNKMKDWRAAVVTWETEKSDAKSRHI